MNNSTTSRFEKTAAYSLVVAALFIHYHIFFLYAENLPKWDDFANALRFVNTYVGADSWSARLSAIFAQHNEHRTVINRLLYAFMYELTGKLDFKILMLIGDLSTIGIVFLIAAQFRKKIYYPFVLSITAIFLLNLHSWGSMFWTMAAISNYCVVLFALAAIHALTTKAKQGFFWAILLGVLATFSQGNGLLVWPIGVVCLLLNRQEKQQRNILTWLLAALICTALYFYDYTAPYTIATSHDLASSIQAWRRLIIWFFTFIGACWAFESGNMLVAASAGAIIFTASVPAMLFLRHKAPALGCFVLFILLSASIATYSRFSEYEYVAALASRYRIYSVYLSCVLLISAYLYLQKYRINSRAIKIGMLLIAIVHTSASYAASFGPMTAAQRDLKDAMRLWMTTTNKKSIGSIWISPAIAWAEKAIISGFWEPRELFPDMLYFRRWPKPEDCARENFSGDLPVSIMRKQSALAGELVVDDGPLRRAQISRVIVCRERRAYSADFADTARTLEGKLIFHFFKIDPVETADRIIFESTTGSIYKGLLSQQPLR